jgi:hypothetical protein
MNFQIQSSIGFHLTVWIDTDLSSLSDTDPDIKAMTVGLITSACFCLQLAVSFLQLISQTKRLTEFAACLEVRGQIHTTRISLFLSVVFRLIRRMFASPDYWRHLDRENIRWFTIAVVLIVIIVSATFFCRTPSPRRTAVNIRPRFLWITYFHFCQIENLSFDLMPLHSISFHSVQCNRWNTAGMSDCRAKIESLQLIKGQIKIESIEGATRTYSQDICPLKKWDSHNVDPQIRLIQS